MSRPVVVSGYHHFAQSPFGGAGASSHMYGGGGGGGRLPIQRAPEQQLAPASSYHLQHTSHHQHQHAHAQLHGRTATSLGIRMSGPAYNPSDEELAAQLSLASEYEPESTGPLVGDRQSSAAITQEYATADPVYRVKTAALPRKFPYVRTCRGDGHCGWRAIAFSYFELLLRVGDVHKFEDEEVRFKSMVNILRASGFNEEIVSDFAEEAFTLLRELKTSLQNMDSAADSILLQAFNDYGRSMGIITYFKCLASAWIQSNPNDFLPFLDFPDLKSYCEANIDRAVAEIDHLALVALGEVLVKPAGFRVEVMYLDRSPGEEINPSSTIEPLGQEGFPLPTMRLLYRPGHYDILYKAEDLVPAVQAQPPLHVALAGYTDEFVPMSSSMTDVMTLIPGMYPTGIGQRWPSVSYDCEPNPAPQPQVTPVSAYAPAPTPITPVTCSHQEYDAPVHVSHVSHYNPPSHHSIRLEAPPVSIPMHSAPPPPMPIERGLPTTIERGGPFRPSVYNSDSISSVFGTSQQHPQSFSTPIFRNSHYNVAHFMNSDFQPEMWSPESDFANGNRGRHK